MGFIFWAVMRLWMFGFYRSKTSKMYVFVRNKEKDQIP